MSKMESEETWEAGCERLEREEEQRAALTHAEAVRIAYASPDAPPVAPDSVIRLTGATGVEPPGAIGVLLLSVLTRSLDYVSLLPVLKIPLNAVVAGEGADDGTTVYRIRYMVDGEGQMIDLGPDRVLAEWAEGILAERRWRGSPRAKRWQHPRPSDLV